MGWFGLPMHGWPQLTRQGYEGDEHASPPSLFDEILTFSNASSIYSSLWVITNMLLDIKGRLWMKNLYVR
jgi:hypothetical protein